MKKWVLKSFDDTYVACVKGHYIETTELVCAVSWNDKERATKILNRCLPKDLRKRHFCVSLASDCDPCEELNGITFSSVEAAESLTQISLESWEKYGSELESKNALASAHSRVDGAIRDIQHYIELYSFDEEQALKMYKLLRYYLRQRRIIKNKLAIFDALANSTEAEKEQRLQGAVARLERRIYHPRVLDGLFDVANINK